MEQSKHIGANREFLNEDPSISLSAMIGYNIKLYTWNDGLMKEKEKFYDQTEIDFSITSCHKKLNLDFDIDSKEQMKNSLHKLDTIIKMCELMKVDLKKARLIINEGNKKRTKLEEQEKKKK